MSTMDSDAGSAVSMQAPVHPTSDLEIARSVRPREIVDVAADLGIPRDALIPYGWDKAKVGLDHLAGLSGPKGRLVLVTAISPTPAGEGKTTTTVGLGDGLKRIGKRAMICLREPSLGPCFGQKGGAAGGGRAQIIPMEDINLHFTGDFHAITAAHNLLAAMVDNHLHHGNALGLDPGRIAWRRVMDMNDRVLRDIVVGLGGPANGLTRQTGFDITVASEVMAILCLARNLADLEERIGRIVVGLTGERRPVTAREVGAAGAMTALLRTALAPNLVQTLEATPAFVHGGPFANIAHGCNSVVATESALALADYVVTEAGFGADLGAEKFFDIKCRQAGLSPSVAVVVCTVRALKMHGGVAKADLSRPDAAAVARGAANLARHLENVAQFGVPALVAINRFSGDTDAEVEAVAEAAGQAGARAFLCTHWADGSAGIEDLARAVVEVAEGGTADFRPLYPDDMPLWDKIDTIARRIYRAERIEAADGVRRQLETWEREGHGRLPVCIAKTQSSFSTDPALVGAPTGFTVPVREVRLSAGAGFVVALTGSLMTMPGLPRAPAAERIGIDAHGLITGLS